MKVTNFYRIV